MDWECNRCAACCRNAHLFPIAHELDMVGEDGACKYLVGNECSIYDTRPNACRMDFVPAPAAVKIAWCEFNRTLENEKQI